MTLSKLSIGQLSNNATTAVVVIAGLLYLGFLGWSNPDAALVQALPVLGAVFGLAKLLHQTAAAEAAAATAADAANVAADQAAAAKRTAAVAVESSRQNNAQLADLGAQVSDQAVALGTNTEITQQIVTKVDNTKARTDGVYSLVDGQMTDFKKMMGEFASLKAEFAAAQAHAVGITEGRAQIITEGATPAHGTPIVDVPPLETPGAA